MYVLDSFTGVTLFRLDFLGSDSISLNVDREFGQITIFGGNVIKEFNNSLIMVLC